MKAVYEHRAARAKWREGERERRGEQRRLSTPTFVLLSLFNFI
jgi:hypothetical protein